MIDEFMQGVVAALPSTVVSLLFSGLLLYYLRKYIDAKLAAEEKRRQDDHKLRRQRSELERRRRAAGRVLFWLHHAVTKPPPNGELEEAWASYQAAEDAQKALDQQILADYETGGGH